jgi:phage gp36-like protein
MATQYAYKANLVSLGITPAQAARFGDDAINAQLQAASGVADGYLPSQFTLPLVTWDMSLTLAVCQIAAYQLFCQFGFNPESPADQLITLQYKNGMKFLMDIRDKNVFPPYTDSSGAAESPDEAGVYVDSEIPVGFTGRGAFRRRGLVGDGGGGFF